MLSLTLPLSRAHAADMFLNPYATDVRKALAATPAETTTRKLDVNGGESAACHQLRAEMERARSGSAGADTRGRSMPGAQPGQQRMLSGPQPGAPSGQAQALEMRYNNECR